MGFEKIIMVCFLLYLWIVIRSNSQNIKKMLLDFFGEID